MLIRSEQVHVFLDPNCWPGLVQGSFWQPCWKKSSLRGRYFFAQSMREFINKNFSSRSFFKKCSCQDSDAMKNLADFSSELKKSFLIWKSLSQVDILRLKL